MVFGVAFGAAGHDTQLKPAVLFSSQHFGQAGRDLVVAHDQVVAGMGVDGYMGVAEVAVHDARLVLLVVVHPQLDSSLGHSFQVTAQRSGRYPGLSTGSEKHDRRPSKLAAVASGKTIE